MRSPLSAVFLVAFGVLGAIHATAIAGYAPTDYLPMTAATVIALLGWDACIRTVRWSTGVTVEPFGLVARLPRWARYVFYVVSGYALLSIGLYFLVVTRGGQVQTIDGRTVLAVHGEIIRELDEEGLRALDAWEARIFSGAVLPLLLLPGLFY